MPYKDREDQRRCGRLHYQANKDAYKARARANNERRRAELRAVTQEARNRPCHDCGVQYPYYVMQFDHRGEDAKAFTIGSAVSTSRVFSLAKLLAEIKKCDVVCANCHAVRTHRRRIAAGLVPCEGFEPPPSRSLNPGPLPLGQQGVA